VVFSMLIFQKSNGFPVFHLNSAIFFIHIFQNSKATMISDSQNLLTSMIRFVLLSCFLGQVLATTLESVYYSQVIGSRTHIFTAWIRNSPLISARKASFTRSSWAKTTRCCLLRID
jgi:hypothetical protein